MNITPAQAACNARALARLGGRVLLDGVDVLGDFTAALGEREVGGMLISATEPMCVVLDGDVPARPVGKQLVVNGVVYTIRQVKADDLGFTVLSVQRGA